MHSLTKAVRALTIAVWCVCAIWLFQVGFYVVTYVKSSRLLKEAVQKGTEATPLSIKEMQHNPAENEKGPPFEELKPEDMISRSTVILLTTFQKDNDRFKAVIAEIIKQPLNTQNVYRVGDEYPPLSYYQGSSSAYGTGDVVFLTGSPPEMRFSCSYAEGKIGGLGGMPLSKFREMVKASNK
jgi:hypothetical protein